MWTKFFQGFASVNDFYTRQEEGMRCVIQRIRDGKVYVNGETAGKAGHGLLILCGFTEGDTAVTADYMASRIVKMRIFPDENGKLNKSLLDERGDALIVSNFTLYADCAHGTRPDFSKAAKREVSLPVYNRFVESMSAFVHTETGVFGEHMELEIYSDGPITVVFDK